MGVRLAFQLEDGVWLELRRVDQKHFYAYLTNENMKVSDQDIGVYKEKEIGNELLKLLYQLKQNRN